MQPRIETPLGKALRAHRDGHPECDGLHCQEYLDIARRATAERQIYEGPRHGHTWLSVREAVDV